MAPAGQNKNQNFLTLSTSLEEQNLTLSHFQGREKISSLFEFELDLFSDSNSINFDELIAKKGTIKINLGLENTQLISGIFGRFEQISTPPKNYSAVTRYKAWLYPKLWLLQFSSNCKIFQNKSAMDIIKEILTEHTILFSDKTQTCGKSQIEFCVQYNESDFAFISRLMEEAGIFYFFSQGEEGETLVLADSPDAHESCPHVSEVKIMYGDVTQPFLMSMVECRLVQRVIPGSNKLVDYSYQTPSTALNASQEGSANAHGGKIYQYPGGFQQQSAGETLAKMRLESIEMLREVVEGTSTIPFFMTGYTFDLSNHPRTSLNEKYTLYEIRHEGRLVEKLDDEGMVTGRTLSYQNNFVGVPSSIPIRAPLVTPKPRIFGTQTAKVTGKKEEEIFTEDLGRIKVKFHWDQSEAKDDTTSCWIRVSYPWAGQQWGFLSTPRVGQEVVVAFIDGDPDLPIVVGSVYNGENKPPYLPEKTAQSGIKSNSSKGGKGSNEFRFDDTKGSEEVYFHAQKDYNKVVENNESVKIVSGSRTVVIEAQPPAKEEETPAAAEGEAAAAEGEGSAAEGAEGSAAAEAEGSAESKAESGAEQEAEKEAEQGAEKEGEQEAEKEAESEAEGAAEGEAEGAAEGEAEGALEGGAGAELSTCNDSLTLNNGNKTVKIIKGNYEITIDEGNMTITMAAGNMSIKASENITLEAGETITIKAGDAINMEATNMVTVKAGEDVSVTAGGAISEKATGEHTIEAGGDISRTAAGAISDEATGDVSISAGGGTEISAGGDVSVTGGGAAEFTGGGDASLTAGGACEITGGGTTSITGATVEVTGATVLLS